MRRLAIVLLVGLFVIGMLAPAVMAKGSMRAVRALAVSKRADSTPRGQGSTPYAVTVQQKQTRLNVVNVKGKVVNDAKIGCTTKTCPTSDKYARVTKEYERPKVLGPSLIGGKLGAAFTIRH